MTITIEIEEPVAQELNAALAAQAGRGPANVEAWIRNVLEQNIASVTAGRLQTQAVMDARAAMEAAQRELVRAAAGITRITVG